jgi:DNA-binding CsgD family transcriptional regulator
MGHRDALTRTQLEVFRRLVQGQTSKEIAAALGVTKGAITSLTCRYRIARGLRTNEQAVALLIRSGELFV